MPLGAEINAEGTGASKSSTATVSSVDLGAPPGGIHGYKVEVELVYKGTAL